MQLQYRGIPYQFNASLVTAIPGDVIGKYRGSTLNIQQPVTLPAGERLIRLKYRGICYQASAHHS